MVKGTERSKQSYCSLPSIAVGMYLQYTGKRAAWCVYGNIEVIDTNITAQGGRNFLRFLILDTLNRVYEYLVQSVIALFHLVPEIEETSEYRDMLFKYSKTFTKMQFNVGLNP